MAAKLRADESTVLRWKSLRNVGGSDPTSPPPGCASMSNATFGTDDEGRPVQQIRLGNPKDETFKTEVDVTSARNKLVAALLG